MLGTYFFDTQPNITMLLRLFTSLFPESAKVFSAIILWMDGILHHFETTTNHWLLEFTGFSVRNGFRPSAVYSSIIYLKGLSEKRGPSKKGPSNQYMQYCNIRISSLGRGAVQLDDGITGEAQQRGGGAELRGNVAALQLQLHLP